MVNNTNAPWLPRPAVSPCNGRVVTASEDGNYGHPLKEQLDGLSYPSWQLATPMPRQPAVRPHPLDRLLLFCLHFVYCDTAYDFPVLTIFGFATATQLHALWVNFVGDPAI